MATKTYKITQTIATTGAAEPCECGETLAHIDIRSQMANAEMSDRYTVCVRCGAERLANDGWGNWAPVPMERRLTPPESIFTTTLVYEEGGTCDCCGFVREPGVVRVNNRRDEEEFAVCFVCIRTLGDVANSRETWKVSEGGYAVREGYEFLARPAAEGSR